eukprot:5963773-Pyramimonas_sp.AAC.1
MGADGKDIMAVLQAIQAQQAQDIARTNDSIKATDSTVARLIQLEPQMMQVKKQMTEIEQKLESKSSDCMKAVNALNDDMSSQD